jgi:hypothetical protein
MTTPSNDPSALASPTTSRTPLWGYAGMEEILPEGLPVGALTVIRLKVHGSRSHWPSAVGRLVLGSVSAGRPVTYVPVGGDEASGRLLRAKANSPLLAMVRDEDVSFTAPVPVRNVLGHRDWIDVARRFSCAVPTLHSIEAGLRSHETATGPSLVVLDEIQYARPYWQAWTDQVELSLPGGLRLTFDQASLWRTRDLLEFAESRSHAPTVAVWHERNAEDEAACAALVKAALVVINCMLMEDGRVLFAVSARATLQDALPFQKLHADDRR